MLDRLPNLLLRVEGEGLAVAAAAVVLYFHEDFGWILFVALILAPDLSFAAYAFGPKVGAIAYDAVHTDSRLRLAQWASLPAPARRRTRTSAASNRYTRERPR